MIYLVGMLFLVGAIVGCLIARWKELAKAENMERDREKQKELRQSASAFTYVGGGFVVAAILWTIGMGVVITPAGMVGVPVWFGSVQQQDITAGMRVINPMTEVNFFGIRRDTVDFLENKEKGSKSNPPNGPAVLVLSQDRNPLVVEVSFPYNLNQGFVWKMLRNVSKSDDEFEAKVLETNARKTVGEVFARHPWVEATLTNRTAIEEELQKDFARSVYSDLETYGFAPNEAKQLVTIGKPQLREVKPDAKVLNAIAERLAAEEQLKKQTVLTSIAAQEAERRKNEGQGIANLFNSLPKDFHADQVAAILYAVAAKENADTLTKAVEGGRVQVLPLPMSSPLALSLPTQK